MPSSKGLVVTGLRAMAVVLLCVCGSPDRAPAGDDRPQRRVADAELQKAINAAVARGVRYIKAAQAPNGSWSYSPRDRTEMNVARGTRGGMTALALYSLSASGIASSDAVIRRGLQWIRSNQESFSPESPFATYSVSFLVLALTRISARDHGDYIRKLARRIEDGALSTVGWTYDLRPAKSRRKLARASKNAGGTPTQGDMSNTQFAVLGLWAAQSLAGYKVKRSTWKRLRQRLAKLQRESGEWPYYLGKGGGFSGSMTAAGVVSYAYAHAGAAGGPEHLEAARQAKVTKMGLRAFMKYGGDDYEDGYYAYSAERVGTVLARAPSKWYVDGAEALVKLQAKDGHWGPAKFGDTKQVYETALTLLFLSRATAATITGK